MSAASRTPFEATHRVFVLERADTMNDEAANSLLKTLEEPPSYVVLLLLTDRLTPGAADDHLALPAGALRPAARGRARAAPAVTRRRARGRRRRARGCRSATASGRSRWRSATGPALRARAEAFARAPLAGRADAERPWRPLLDSRPRGAAARPRSRSRRALAEELAVPAQEGAQAARDRVHRARPAGRAAGRRPARSTTRSSSSASGIATSPASSPARPSSSTTATALDALREDADGREHGALLAKVASSSTTPARGCALNVSEELALEALAYRLESMTEVHVHGAARDGPRARARGRGRGRGAAGDPRRRRAARRHDAHARQRRGARARVPVRRGADRRAARRRAAGGSRRQHGRGHRPAAAPEPARARSTRAPRAGCAGRARWRRSRCTASRRRAGPALARDLVADLPERLRQPTFARTGGLHATGLFTPDGELVAVREDVGRHNAMDKVVGWALREGLVPLHPTCCASAGGCRSSSSRRRRWRARRSSSASARRPRSRSGSPTTAASRCAGSRAAGASTSTRERSGCDDVRRGRADRGRGRVRRAPVRTPSSHALARR